MFRSALGIVALSVISTLSWAEPEQPVQEKAQTLGNPCTLIKAGAFAPWGYGEKPRTQPSSRPVKKEVMGSPGDFRSAVCNYSSVKGKGNNHRKAAFLVLETFGNEVTPESISDWLKTMDAKAKSKMDPSEKNEHVTFGDTVCETGEYSVVTEHQAPPTIMHYVACDRQLARNHVALNFEWPGKGPKLPTSAQTKALLDQAVASLPNP